jgi:hypothetical protein
MTRGSFVIQRAASAKIRSCSPKKTGRQAPTSQLSFREIFLVPGKMHPWVLKLGV